MTSLLDQMEASANRKIIPDQQLPDIEGITSPLPSERNLLDMGALGKFIEGNEGRRNQVYPDTLGNPTIGVGFNLNRAGAKNRIEGLGYDYDKILAGTQTVSDPHIDLMRDEDVQDAVAIARNLFPGFDNLVPARQAILADMAMMGATKLAGFTDLRGAIAREDWNTAAAEIQNSFWFTQVGTRGPRNVDAMRLGELTGFSSPIQSEVDEATAGGSLLDQMEAQAPDPLLALTSAQGTSADENAAQQQRVANAGLPPETANAMGPALDPLLAAELGTTVAELQKLHPATARFLATKRHADVAHDALPELGAIELVTKKWELGLMIRDLGLLGSEFRATQNPAMIPFIRDLQSRISVLSSATEAEGFVSFLGQASEVLGNMYGTMTSAQFLGTVGTGTVVGGVAGAPAGPPGIIAGALTGTGAGATVGVAMDTFMQEGGNSYVELLDSGVEEPIARAMSMFVGATNAGLEVAGLTIILKPFAIAAKKMMRKSAGEVLKRPGVRKAAFEFVKYYATGIGVEVGVEVAQEMMQILGEEAGKYLSEIDLETTNQEEVTDRLAQIAEKTFKAMVLLAPAGPSVNFTVDQVKSRRAKRLKEQLEDTAKGLGQSPVTERAPAVAAEHVAESAKEVGITEMYVDAEQIQEAAVEEEGGAASVYERMGIADQMESALALGGDVVMSVKNYSQFILQATGARMKSLIDHTRVEQDGMTPAEAKEFEATGLEDEIARLGLEEEQETVKQAAIKVGDEIFEGQTHADAVDQAIKAGKLEEGAGALHADDTGFSTSLRPFVTRQEAKEIAVPDKKQLGFTSEEFLVSLSEKQQPQKKFPTVTLGGRELSFEDTQRVAANQTEELSRADKLADSPFLVFDTRTKKGFEGIFPTEKEAKQFIEDSDSKFLDYATPRGLEEANPSGPESFEFMMQELRKIADAAQEITGITNVVPFSPEEQQARKEGTPFVGPTKAPEGIDAFHVSPHDFAEFKLESGKFGTGAAFQGFGLNFGLSTRVTDFFGGLFQQEGRPTNLFKVKLTIKKDQLLDWDIPLNQQSPAVQTALVKLLRDPKRIASLEASLKGELEALAVTQKKIKARNEEPGKFQGVVDLHKGLIEDVEQLLERANNPVVGDQLGKQFYRELSKKLGGDKAASKALDKEGIVGTISKDTDLELRNEPSITIFNPKNVQIIEKNGVPVTEPELLERLINPVEIAEVQIGLGALFRTADEAGMTEATYSSYLAAVAKARERAENRQKVKKLRQIERENTEAFQKTLQKTEARIREGKLQEPVYQALAGIGRERLNREDVVAALAFLGKDIKLEDLPTQKRGRTIYSAKRDTVTLVPQTYAELHGYDTTQDMLEDMLSAPPLEETVKTEAMAEMRSEHEDFFTIADELRAALESLHTDNHAEVLVAELNSLREAKGAGKVKISQVARATRRMMQTMKISELKPSRFLAEERRQGRQAGLRIRKGDREMAAKNKFRQLLNFQAALEAFKLRDKLRAQRKFIKKLLKPRKKDAPLPLDFDHAIRTLLEPYEFGAQLSAKKRNQLEEFMREREAQGLPVEVPQRILDNDNLQNWQDLTLEEFNEIYATAKALNHQGLQANHLLDKQRQQEINEVAHGVATQVLSNFKPREKRIISAQGAVETARRFGQGMLGSILTADSIVREMDGFKDLGVAWKALRSPLFRAISEGYRPDQIGYTRRQKQESEALLRLFKQHFTKKQRRQLMLQKISIPDVGLKLTRNEYMSVLLNLGNQSSREAMVASKNQLTEPELDAIIQFASKEDMAFVQDVWDYFDNFWEEISASEIRRHGLAPEKVEAVPVETRHGVFKGGYYPLVYDRNLSILERRSKAERAKSLEDMRTGKYSKSHTKRDHVETRKEANSKAVKLDLFVVHRHIQQIIYDLEVGDAAQDTFRILHHPNVTEAFEERGAIPFWDALDLHLQDAMTGELMIGDWLESSLRWLRAGFTISKLGYNMGTILLQPLGVFNTMVQVGKGHTLAAMAQVMSSAQFGPNNIYAYVTKQTGFMESRSAQYQVEITQAQQLLSKSLLQHFTPGRSLEITKNTLFLGIKITQRWADTVTWLAAKRKGLSDGMSEKDANLFADSMVSRSQASGLATERSNIERGSLSVRGVRQSELIKQFTPLISYFVAKTNIFYEQVKTTNPRNPAHLVNFVANIVLLYTFEAALVALVRNQWPDEGIDPEADSVPWFLLKETFSTMMAGAPFWREFHSEAVGFRGGGVFSTAVEGFGGTYKQVQQGEVDFALARAGINLMGMLFHFPSSQPLRTAYARQLASQGYDISWLEYMLGVDRAKHGL